MSSVDPVHATVSPLAPSGLPVIQSALVSLMEFLRLETIVEKTAHNPARIFQCQERGFICEGCRAGLVLVDTVHGQRLLFNR